MTALALSRALSKWLNLYTPLGAFVAFYTLLLMLMGRGARELVPTRDLRRVTEERIN